MRNNVADYRRIRTPAGLFGEPAYLVSRLGLASRMRLAVPVRTTSGRINVPDFPIVED